MAERGCGPLSNWGAWPPPPSAGPAPQWVKGGWQGIGAHGGFPLLITRLHQGSNN